MFTKILRFYKFNNKNVRFVSIITNTCAHVGLLICAVAHKKYMNNKSKIFMCEISSQIYGNYKNIYEQINSITTLHNRMISIYVENGLTIEQKQLE
jgi:ATP-dependent protease ClpP protease subunit